MARAFGYTFRIITLEGEVLIPGGSITGGTSRNRTSGLLGRAREIKKLQKEVADTIKKIESLEQSNARTESEMLKTDGNMPRLEKHWGSGA
jgi:chromosome segregation protein